MTRYFNSVACSRARLHTVCWAGVGDCAARGVERAVVVCVCLCAPNAHPFFLQGETSCEDQHCSKRDIVYDTDDASICRIMDKEALAIKDF